MSKTTDLVNKVREEKQQLNELIVSVKMDKEKNKSLVKKKKKDIARLLTQINASNGEQNDG